MSTRGRVPEPSAAVSCTASAPVFFSTPGELRGWFARHHSTKSELLVGFYKRGSGVPSITWPESVDEALCVGWIDGIRRPLDQQRYTIRFTPRRTRSIWSAVNIARVQALSVAGRMQPAGLSAFAARRENRSGLYSYEQRPVELPEPYAGVFSSCLAAWGFFTMQPPSYRKKATWWVLSAKREETRLTRLQKLIALSEAALRLD